MSRTHKLPARFAGATPVAPGGGVSRNPGVCRCLLNARSAGRDDLRTMRFVAGSLRTRRRREGSYSNAPSLQSSVECVDAASYQQKNMIQQRFVVSSRWDLSFERTTSPGFRLTPPPGASHVTPAMRAGNLRGVPPLHPNAVDLSAPFLSQQHWGRTETGRRSGAIRPPPRPSERDGAPAILKSTALPSVPHPTLEAPSNSFRRPPRPSGRGGARARHLRTGVRTIARGESGCRPL